MAKKKKIPLEPGTIVAIPRKRGGYYLAVHITSNQAGDAYGLLKGNVPCPSLPEGWKPIPLKQHMYSGDHHVKKGLWICLDRREELLKHFPEEPEIFHAKQFHRDDPEIGPYGSGETLSGKLRRLTKSEAKKLGLLDGTYQQSMMEEVAEEFLHDTLG